MKIIEKNYKRYLVSTTLTFLAGFAIAVVPLLDNLTLEGIGGGALVGLIFAGVRSGVKLVLESFLGWWRQKK
jgi:hypothetical protein